jgi:hypothetical protein
MSVKYVTKRYNECNILLHFLCKSDGFICVIYMNRDYYVSLFTLSL